jgi:hypothetical protein
MEVALRRVAALAAVLDVPAAAEALAAMLLRDFPPGVQPMLARLRATARGAAALVRAARLWRHDVFFLSTI